MRVLNDAPDDLTVMLHCFSRCWSRPHRAVTFKRNLQGELPGRAWCRLTDLVESRCAVHDPGAFRARNDRSSSATPRVVCRGRGISGGGGGSSQNADGSASYGWCVARYATRARMVRDSMLVRE